MIQNGLTIKLFEAEEMYNLTNFQADLSYKNEWLIEIKNREISRGSWQF